ncbi:MAG: transposase [Crinalium sp.]
MSRAISDLGWQTFREMLTAKAEKYGRDLRVINRWEPTSQRCSCCGKKGGKKELNIREWTCLFCNTTHYRQQQLGIRNQGREREPTDGY